jgi:hypothetical protein
VACDQVFVDDEQVAEALEARVVVAVEGERVPAVEPVRARRAALARGPFRYHLYDSLSHCRFKKYLVHVAPTPVLATLEGADYGMAA